MDEYPTVALSAIYGACVYDFDVCVRGDIADTWAAPSMLVAYALRDILHQCQVIAVWHEDKHGYYAEVEGDTSAFELLVNAAYESTRNR